MSTSYSPPEPSIRIEDLTIGYGGQAVQSGIDLNIASGEIFAIVGDSGSGKSTLMKAMIGLLRPQSGRIMIEDRPANVPRDGAPVFGVLFQSGALWTSMSVLDNVMLPMELHGFSAPSARPAVALFKLALVGLSAA